MCLDVCGDKPGVLCNGNKTRKDEITCSCRDEKEMFIQKDKDCKGE